MTGVLFVATGVAVVAFCIDVITGWHASKPAPAIPLGLERIQYDTAWAFAFAGAALVAVALHLGALTRLFAAVPIALGGLRIIAYAVPDLIPIRPMLAVPWLPFGAGGYNDMGVLTALILIALGFALATMNPAARRPLRSVIASFTSATAVALALLLLFGAWTGGSAAMRWLLLTGGDRTNALLAIVVSGAIIADALARHPRGTPRRPPRHAGHRLVRRVRMRSRPVARARPARSRGPCRIAPASSPPASVAISNATSTRASPRWRAWASGPGHGR